MGCVVFGIWVKSSVNNESGLAENKENISGDILFKVTSFKIMTNLLPVVLRNTRSQADRSKASRYFEAEWPDEISTQASGNRSK